MMQNGKNLSMHNDAIWKGTFTDNGVLLKLHENAYTIGYSALLAPDGKSAGAAKFGGGVFYDANQKNNQVYTGAPTATGAVPKFAGVIVRESAIASGYPAKNNEVQAFQKGLLVREGYIIYKTARLTESTTDAGTTTVTVDDDASSVADSVMYGDAVYASETDGTIIIAGKDGAGSGVVEIGRVVEVNPDDKSVTAFISPKFYL